VLELVYLPAAAILLDTRELLRLAGTVWQKSRLSFGSHGCYSEL